MEQWSVKREARNRKFYKSRWNFNKFFTNNLDTLKGNTLNPILLKFVYIKKWSKNSNLPFGILPTQSEIDSERNPLGFNNI